MTGDGADLRLPVAGDPGKRAADLAHAVEQLVKTGAFRPAAATHTDR